MLARGLSFIRYAAHGRDMSIRSSIICTEIRIPRQSYFVNEARAQMKTHWEARRGAYTHCVELDRSAIRQIGIQNDHTGPLMPKLRPRDHGSTFGPPLGTPVPGPELVASAGGNVPSSLGSFPSSRGPYRASNSRSFRPLLAFLISSPCDGYVHPYWTCDIPLATPMGKS